MDFPNPSTAVTALYTPVTFGGTASIAVSNTTALQNPPSLANPILVAFYRAGAGGAGYLVSIYNVIGISGSNLIHNGPATGYADVPLLPGDMVQFYASLQEANYFRGVVPILNYSDNDPALHGFVDWNYDPIFANTATGLLAVTGDIFLVQFVPRCNFTITNINWYVVTANGTPTAAENWTGLYDGVTGAQLGVSADQSTAWGSTGVVASALTTPYAVTAGRPYYAAVLSNGTTAPKLATGTAIPAVADAGRSASQYRFAVNGTGTVLPATLTLTSNSHTAAESFWVAFN